MERHERHNEKKYDRRYNRGYDRQWREVVINRARRRPFKVSHGLAIFFTINMIIASLCAFIVSSLINSSSASNDIKNRQYIVASALLELEKNTDFDYNEMVSLAAQSLYKIELTQDAGKLRIPDGKTAELENKIPVYINNFFIPTSSKTVVKLKEGYVTITISDKNNYAYSFFMQTGLTLIFSVIIGTLTITMMSRHAVRPVIDLKKATQEVAKGNFDIEVKSSRHDEFKELTNNFNKMTKELKGIEHLRTDFISNVSHEFKTPIASILGFAKLLQNDKDLTEEEKEEYLDIIIEESEKLSKLSSNILKMSKIENQQISFKNINFDVDEQIRKTILLLENEWSSKQINFEIELEKCPYYGDVDILSSVWTNLLGNAIKFTGENGNIEVKSFNFDKKITVIIKDDGTGMTEEVQKHIFEKFYQGDKTRSSEGNGLGLAMVKKVIDITGGTIKVESSPGNGSCFTVELPHNNDSQ